MRDFPILLMIYFSRREFVKIMKMDGITMDVEFQDNFQEYLDIRIIYRGNKLS